MELEIALALPDDLSITAVRDWLQNQTHVSHMRTTTLTNIYLDTPSQDLRRQKSALRLRFDNDKNQWLQTLKTSGETINGVSVRHEWEEAITEAKIELAAFDQDAQDYLSEHIETLTPIFETNFQRHIYQYDFGGERYEYAIDCGEVRLPHQEKHTKIYELEIELKQGNADGLRQLASQAQMQLNAKPQKTSKAARGYHLLNG